MRIVSLVPSLTETLHAWGLGGSIVGVTKFCVAPEEARETAAVIGGTKDPDVERIKRLVPDLVVADEDENKPEHLNALRDAKVQVHVTRIAGVADTARELRAIGRLVGRQHEAEREAGELEEAAQNMRSASRVAPSVACFVPIWKRPLMTMGPTTYMSDLLAIAGGRNIFDHAVKKYFEVDTEEVRAGKPDAILLPTEPYRFHESDRRYFSERFEVPLEAVLVVDGQAFTWFGTRSRASLDVIAAAVARVRAATPKAT